MSNKLFCLWIALTIITSPSFSQLHQLGSPIITNFEKAIYRAGSQNWEITQDAKGIMYIANNAGLIEFDGEKWKVYQLPNLTIVRSVAIDRQGKIFVGGQNEMGYFSANSKGALEYTTLKNLVPAPYNSFEDIWKILITSEGVFFCSQKVVFQYKDGNIKIIQSKAFQSQFLFLNFSDYIDRFFNL